MVEGTGLCQCDSITEVEEVCDITCQGLLPESTLNHKGEMEIKSPVLTEEGTQAIDPTTNEKLFKTAVIDPTSLPGYYGNFKCESSDPSQETCKTRQMGEDDGSFTYEFSPNADLLAATDIPDNNEI